MPAEDLLPLLDEHSIVVAAGVGDLWASLLDVLDRTSSLPGARVYARIVGCADADVSGPRPLAVGATIPGFRVVSVVPEHELALEGRHAFSSYALRFRLEPVAATSSRLRAESRAVFPGVRGRVYRLLVVGTRGHVFAVRRMLRGVRRRAEQRGAQ